MHRHWLRNLPFFDEADKVDIYDKHLELVNFDMPKFLFVETWYGLAVQTKLLDGLEKPNFVSEHFF